MEFDRFAAMHHARLVALLTLYCGDRWVAEELAQDAMVRARERWGQLAEMSEPGGWLYRVAVNLANSRFRRRGAERRAYRRYAAGDPQVDEGQLSADAVTVRALVAALPASQRAAIVYRYFLDLSVEETARAMGMTPGSVKSATHRGLTALRRQFDVDAPDGQEVRDVP